MRNQASSNKKRWTIIRIIKAPIRAISKALDLYAKGATNFATNYNKPYRSMPSTPNYQHSPMRFGTSRLFDYEQSPEGALVRSISSSPKTGSNDTNHIKNTDLELYLVQYNRQQLQSYASRKSVLKNDTHVGMMRKIEEDRALSFRDDNFIFESSSINIKNGDSALSRSRSYDRKSTKRSLLM